MMTFGLPSLVTVVPYNLNLRLDQMLMAVVFAPRLLGLYVAAVAWAAIMTPLFQAIAIVLFPHIASHTVRNQQVSELTGILKLGVPLAVIISTGLAILTPWGLPWIFGASFRPAEGPAVVLAFAGALLAINQMLEEGLRGLGAPKAVMWSELGGLTVDTGTVGIAAEAGGHNGRGDCLFVRLRGGERSTAVLDQAGDRMFARGFVTPEQFGSFQSL